jgi:MFS family permease
VKGFLQYFMNYGLMAAVLVWAAVVGLMAYHLEDSPWRWAFVALAAGGIATVGVILKIRTYIDRLDESPQQEPHS